MPRPPHLLARLAAIALVGALGLGGCIAARSLLYGGVAWLGFLFFVLSGWGYLVIRAARVADPDFGLRAVYGTGGLLAIAGLFLGLDHCNALVIAGLVVVGYAGFVWRELVTPVPLAHQARALLATARANPGWAVIVGALALLAAYQLVGAVVRFRGNEYDDDLVYNGFMRRLLDLGDMNEPFSFRRVSAYGGQIILNATAAIRGTMANIFLVEQGLFQGLAILVALGAARQRRLDPIWQVLLVLVVLLLPDNSINTASYWTGVAGFVALYRVVVAIDAAEGRDAIAHGIIAAVLGAAICTLRQNYLPVVVLFLGFFVARRVLTQARLTSWRVAVRRERGLAIALGAAATLTLVPYFVAAYRSSGTFLFPMMPGTWNPGLQLTPVVWSGMQELEFFVWCCIEPHGIVVVIPLFCVVLFSRDTRAGSPLMMFFLAVGLSFVVLVHSFTSSDPTNLWRYAFGYSVALTLMLAIEVGPARQARAVVASWVARWVLLAALLLQLFETRTDLRWKLHQLSADLRAGFTAERRRDKRSMQLDEHYARLQAAIPVGAKVMTMLDAAGHLDFTRNDLVILDTPGWCSLAPGYPSFKGPEAIRRYLTGLGMRYLAFVRPERSVAAYRRDAWLPRIFTDLEVFRTMGAYLVDTIDAFAELASRCKVLYDEDGFVVLDLEACS